MLASELLGFPPGTRVLLVNADDLGMNPAVNRGVLDAQEHGLAVRVWHDRGRDIAHRRGRPVVDHDFLDSFQLDVEAKDDRYAALLRSLPAGLTEWAVHPATAHEPPAPAAPGWLVRSTDHQFLTSARAQELVEAEGIVLIDFRPLQQMWTDAGA